MPFRGSRRARKRRVFVNNCGFARRCAVVLGTCVAFGFTHSAASAAVLYAEDFSDADLAAGTTVDDVEVSGGVLNFVDNTRDDRGVFNVVQNFNSAIMTFSFDVVEPVVHTGNPNELDANNAP